jgi:hypothetical protein
VYRVLEFSLLILADENGIFALHLLEFAGDDERLVHIVDFGRTGGNHPQRGMLDIVQRHPVRQRPHSKTHDAATFGAAASHLLLSQLT